jgi:hypothetical protein
MALEKTISWLCPQKCNKYKKETLIPRQKAPSF